MEGVDVLPPLERDEVVRAFGEIDECLNGSIKLGIESSGNVEGGAVEGDGMEWNQGGMDAVSQLISSYLSPHGGASLLILHYILTSLFNRLSIPLLTSLLITFIPHEHIAVLQEAVVDVVESSVEVGEDVWEIIGRVEETQAEGEHGKKVDVKGDGVTKVENKAVLLIRKLLSQSFLPPLLTSLLIAPSHLSSTSLSNLTAQKISILERRRRTALFFRQHKYNLLRETSMGYTALLILLSTPNTFLAPPKDAWERILELVGMYDLSPPRVLDVVLDAFCVFLEKEWQWFVELIKESPWGEVDVGLDDEVNEMELAVERVSPLLSWKFGDDVKREKGNKMLSQVVGFKFGFYQETTRDLKGIERRVDETPRDLLLMTAILMKHGLLRTVDILPYLSADDKAMAGLGRKFKNETQIKISSLSGNALSAAAALTDDDAVLLTNGTTTTATQDKPKDEKPKIYVEQKVLLCQALLSVGHWSPALLMLSKWPVMAHYHPSISDILLRIVRHMVEPAYRLLEADLAISSSSPVYVAGNPCPVSPPAKQGQLTLVLPQPMDTSRVAFKYFYPAWIDGVPRCTTVEQVAEWVRPFMRLVGPFGARDVQVLVWLIRIGIHQRSIDQSDAVTTAWTDLIRCTLLPSLPLLDCNVSYNNELWPLLQPFPYSFRYALYGEWDVALTDRLNRAYSPAMALAAAQSAVNVRSTLRRVTSGNDRQAARALGKASTAAPTMLWSALLDQIKSYPNMIPSLAKAVSRYGSDLGWDVAMFMLLKTLSDPARDRVKEDGLHAADWLQSVSKFVGVLSRSTDKLHLEPLLQLFANQLKARSLADLVALQTLIEEMTGIEALHDISDSQVACFSGGPILNEEGVHATTIEHQEPPRSDADRTSQLKADKRPERKTAYDKPSQRLISALIKSGLAQPILIAIAQLRKSCVFNATSSAQHTKQLSKKFDECDAIFRQYIRLLYSGMLADEQEYKQILPLFLPTLRAMQHDFGLDLATSFQLLRPKLHWQIYVSREEALRLQLRRAGYRKDLSQEEIHLIEWDEASIISPLLTAVVDVASCLDPLIRKHQLEPFITTFWQLALGEIDVPEKMYSDTIARLHVMAATLHEWSQPSIALNRFWSEAYRSNREHILKRVDALSKETTRQRAEYETSKKRLEQEMKTWFTGINQPSLADPQPLRRKEFGALLHHTCFYPRAIASKADATFVAKFVRYLHDWNAERFSLVAVYEHFFDNKLASCIFSCTETEAASLGRCLSYLLEDAERWRSDSDLFKTEAIGPNPAKANKVLDGMRLSANRHIDWTSFKRLCKKWHGKVLMAITTCLQATDYIHIKNAITVGNILLPHFPRQKSMYEALVKSLGQFKETEKARPDSREDLVLACNSLEAAISKTASRDSSWILPNDLFSPPPPGSKQEAAATPPGPSTPVKVEDVKAKTPIPSEVKPFDPSVSTDVVMAAVEGADGAVAASPSSNTPSGPDIAALRDQLAKSRAEGKLRSAASGTPGSTTPNGVASSPAPNDVKPPASAPTGPRGGGRASRAASPSRTEDARPKSIPSGPRTRDTGRAEEVAAGLVPRGPRLDGDRSQDSRAGGPRPSGRDREAPVDDDRRNTQSSVMPPPPAPRDLRRERGDERAGDRHRVADEADRRSRESRFNRPPADQRREKTPPRAKSPPRRQGSRAASVDSRTSRTSERRRQDRERDGDRRERDRPARTSKDGNRDRETERERSRGEGDRREDRHYRERSDKPRTDDDREARHRDRDHRAEKDRSEESSLKDRRGSERERERPGGSQRQERDGGAARSSRRGSEREVPAHLDMPKEAPQTNRDANSGRTPASRHDDQSSRPPELPRPEPPRTRARDVREDRTPPSNPDRAPPVRSMSLLDRLGPGPFSSGAAEDGGRRRPIDERADGDRLRQQRTPPRELLPGGPTAEVSGAQRDLRVNGHAERTNGPQSELPSRRLPDTPLAATPSRGPSLRSRIGESSSNGGSPHPSNLPPNLNLPAKPVAPVSDSTGMPRGQLEATSMASPSGEGSARKRPAEGSARESTIPNAEIPADATSTPNQAPSKRAKLDRAGAQKRAERPRERGTGPDRLFAGLTGGRVTRSPQHQQGQERERESESK